MAITLEAIRAAGGIVHSDGNIFFRDISMLQGLAGAAPAAVARPAIDLDEVDLPDVEDMAHSAVQEALSCGVNHDVFHRWMRAVMDKTVEAMTAAPVAAPALEAPAAPLDDSELEDLAHSANQECLSFGMSLDPFLRLAKTVRDRMLAAAPQAPATEPVARAIFTNRNKPDVEWLVESVARGMLLYAAPQAPAAPDDVLCYIRPGATLPERHGFEVCRATDVGAMAVMGNGRVAAPAEPASKRIGQILNPAPEHSQDTGSVVVAEIMSNGYNGQVLWKGTVPPVGTLLYAAPVAAPAAPAVDAKGEHAA